jgi:hypothetical protein
MMRNYKAGDRQLALGKTAKRCDKCGFHIRGTLENHENGIHHKHGSDAKATISKSR